MHSSWNPPVPYRRIGCRKIIIQRCWQWNKSPAILRGSTGSAALRHIKRSTGLQMILNNIHNTATDRHCAMSYSKTRPVQNLVPPTALSSSLMCVSAAEYHTEEQYSKTVSTKPVKTSPKKQPISEYSPRLPEIPRIWESALETERRCFTKSSWNQMSLPIYHGHQTLSADFH